MKLNAFISVAILMTLCIACKKDKTTPDSIVNPSHQEFTDQFTIFGNKIFKYNNPVQLIGELICKFSGWDRLSIAGCGVVFFTWTAKGNHNIEVNENCPSHQVKLYNKKLYWCQLSNYMQDIQLRNYLPGKRFCKFWRVTFKGFILIWVLICQQMFYPTAKK